VSPIVRAAKGEEDRKTLERILEESFGTDGMPWATWMERIGHENLRVVVEGGAIRGGLGFYRFGQHWGGERVPMIGLAGVGVAPEARGTGLARRFLVETLAEAKRDEIPLAALYASSVAVYRSVGFEQAGTTIRWSVPLATLPRGDHALACEPFAPAESEPLRPLYEARARSWNGHLARHEPMWQRIAKPYKGTTRGYRFGAASAPEGYVIYTHAPGEDLHFAIVVRDLVLATPAAARRCTALLTDLRSLGNELRWLGCASDPLLSLLPEQTAKVVEHGRWMLRIVDPERALAARGYAADGEVRFEVRDPILGDVGIHLSVRAGRAEITREPTGRARLSLDVRALAALYTGFAHPATLRIAGLLEGPLDEAHLLARLFAGTEPWMCDWF